MSKVTEASLRGLYDELVRDHATDLFALAFRLTGRREVSEDLVQEAFMEAWRSLSTLKDSSRSRSWLMQILRHRWMHWHRARASRPVEDGNLDLVDDRSDSRSDPSESPAHGDLQEALDHLDVRFREPLLMVYMQGLSCQAVAQELDLPLGTVLSRLHRARIVLRGLLSPHAPAAVDEGKSHVRLLRVDGSPS